MVGAAAACRDPGNVRREGRVEALLGQDRAYACRSARSSAERGSGQGGDGAGRAGRGAHLGMVGGRAKMSGIGKSATKRQLTVKNPEIGIEILSLV